MRNEREVTLQNPQRTFKNSGEKQSFGLMYVLTSFLALKDIRSASLAASAKKTILSFIQFR